MRCSIRARWTARDADASRCGDSRYQARSFVPPFYCRFNLCTFSYHVLCRAMHLHFSRIEYRPCQLRMGEGTDVVVLRNNELQGSIGSLDTKVNYPRLQMSETGNAEFARPSPDGCFYR